MSLVRLWRTRARHIRKSDTSYAGEQTPVRVPACWCEGWHVPGSRRDQLASDGGASWLLPAERCTDTEQPPGSRATGAPGSSPRGVAIRGERSESWFASCLALPFDVLLNDLSTDIASSRIEGTVCPQGGHFCAKGIPLRTPDDMIDPQMEGMLFMLISMLVSSHEMTK